MIFFWMYELHNTNYLSNAIKKTYLNFLWFYWAQKNVWVTSITSITFADIALFK